MSNLPTANKELGQHFLKDKKVIHTITSDFMNECDVIVEVGPGPAVLTKELAGHNKPLFTIEMDERFKEQISTCVESSHQFFEDALHFNWPEFINKNKLLDKKIWLVSNLPYNISSQLFINFIQVESIQMMTLMYQKEVGEKTVDRPHIKNQMSSLLAMSQTFFEAKQLCKVYPGAFHPPPKVDSIVVSYKRRANPEVNLTQFSKFEVFLRELFQFRRKQLTHAFRSRFSKESVLLILSESKIDPARRSETLSISEIYTLFNNYILHH